MTIGSALALGTRSLEASGADSPSLDSSLLLCHVLSLSRASLLARYPDPLSSIDEEKFFSLVAQRASGICVAYILGHKEFWGLDFEVSPAVLVPRADTELLVELALAFIDSRIGKNQPPAKTLRILDLCTGSGCLAVTLTHERPSITMTASDLSPEALDVARRNAERLLNPLPADITFVEGNLFESVAGHFDLIVTNPPYVPTGIIPGLSPEVRAEPVLALDGGEDGLDLIRQILPEAFSRLDEGGLLLVESGEEQVETILDLMKETGFTEVSSHRDLAGKLRVSAGYTDRAR